MGTVQVSYDLHPPAGVNNPVNVLPSRSLVYEVRVEGSAAEVESQTYYAALTEAVEKARVDLGEDLTKWRDAVGKLELDKGGKKVVQSDDEDGEEEETEEGV